jgi:hypothetical protein
MACGLLQVYMDLHIYILTPSFQGFESYGDRAKYDGMACHVSMMMYGSGYSRIGL